MATQDISRFLLQPNKHYSSLHLQQGRVIVDSDWNERAGIEAEDLRQTILDIVCARGTPNDGFAITLPDTPPPLPDATIALPTSPATDRETYDFNIGHGSYYLGGLRLAIENLEGETFLTQSDWLQVTSLADYMPLRPATGTGENTRVDLVYLYTWEQPVTAVEDRELAEVALGGRDTSTRVKRMRRFGVKSDVEADCADAFEALILSLSDKATYDSNTGELISKGRLQVTTTLEPLVEDPCADPTASGYVGADNQTIRVELRPEVSELHAGKLIWGFDNASKLYRVQVIGTTVTFLTAPQDLPSMPRAGQVVEFLQWGAKLPNDEKVAEMQGLVTVVTTTYDPNNKELEIEEIAELANWNEWLDIHSEHHNLDDPSEDRTFLYMRVWDRGAQVVATAADALLEYDLEAPVVLGGTGLQVTIVDAGNAGDFWIIAARPSTPEVVTPWDLDLAVGAAPHGPRRFYAPLGLISITDDETLTYVAQDCRTRLRKLCEGGACTVTVGDGKKSFGQFNNLQAAVDFVGPRSKICVLPGEHEGQTLISEVDGLIIEGCGFRSVLKNASPTGLNADLTAFADPVISIKDSSHVFIRDLAITGYSAVGLEIAADELTCSDIKLENLLITSTGGFTTDSTGAVNNWRLPAPGITVAAASEVEIVNCEVTMSDIRGYTFAVVLGGDTLSMRGCKISAPATARVSAALGGVNIRSGSRDVEIIGCEISGGRGHGIALGHGRVYATGEGPTRIVVLKENVTFGIAATEVTEGEDDCPCDGRTGWSVQQKLLTGAKFYPAGVVEDVRIYDNRISGMGGSGISTALYWPAAFDTNGSGVNAPLFIVVTDIDIARNVIQDNTQLLPSATLSNFEFAVGGVCLTASANAWIHENTIRNNGTIFEDVPICGVGMLAAMNAVIEDNQIVDNGRPQAAGDHRYASVGLRGGIAIYEATAVRTRSKIVLAGDMPTFPTGSAEVPPEGVKNWAGVSRQSAVTVRGNEVSQPLGRALWIPRGFGPIVVTGNTLESYGNPVNEGIPGVVLRWSYIDEIAGTDGTLQYGAAGACVEISNYASLVDQTWATLPVFPTLEFVDPGQDELQGGSVLVSGNRMRLDWEWPGGRPASVLVQAIGSVVFNDNASEVVMDNAFSGVAAVSDSEKNWEFATTVCEQEASYTFVLSNVFVGGRGSVSFVGNRLTEARWDALFSGIVGYPALFVADEFVNSVTASLAIANIGSHCIVALPVAATYIKADNVEIYPLDHEDAATGASYSCDDVELYTVNESAPRLVGLRLTIVPPPVP